MVRPPGQNKSTEPEPVTLPARRDVRWCGRFSAVTNLLDCANDFVRRPVVKLHRARDERASCVALASHPKMVKKGRQTGELRCLLVERLSLSKR
jgi:hypothetical protein